MHFRVTFLRVLLDITFALIAFLFGEFIVHIKHWLTVEVIMEARTMETKLLMTMVNYSFKDIISCYHWWTTSPYFLLTEVTYHSLGGVQDSFCYLE